MASRPETAEKLLLHWMDGMVVLVGVIYAGAGYGAVAQGLLTPARGVAAVLSVAAALTLFLIILRVAYDGRPRPTVMLTSCAALSVAAALLAEPLARTQPGMWETVPYFALSAAVFYLPVWGTACAGALLVAAFTGQGAAAGLPWAAALFAQLVPAALMPVATWLWRWLWWTIRDAHDGQRAKARLAVAEERLRFARDLHDLLGHSLSVITLKSELAAKLATKDPAKAAAEMAEVRRLTGESLMEVGLAVDGYRSLDLVQELERARAALEAGGTRCAVRAATADLSPAARALLAWVVREGTTNVLKHSSASWCRITISGGTLEIRNDGVRTPVNGSGSGLRGLAERMAAAGGTFSAAPAGDGEFAVRATVPA